MQRDDQYQRDDNQSQAYQNTNPNELFFWKIKAGVNRYYYINVKKDKNQELYLVIKEVKIDPDGNKEVHRVMVFEKDFKKFVFGMKKCLEFVNEERKLNPRSERQNDQDSQYSQQFSDQNFDYSNNNEFKNEQTDQQSNQQNQTQNYDVMADFDLNSENNSSGGTSNNYQQNSDYSVLQPEAKQAPQTRLNNLNNSSKDSFNTKNNQAFDDLDTFNI
jgi:Protein of unknown function (DUF3276)